jgi:predicted nucleotidyltransferase
VKARKVPDEVSRAASLLSRLGAAKGGKARAAKLSPEQRKRIAQRAIRARWDRYRAKPASDSLVKRPDESLLKEIVRRVLSVAKPERIILFGSAVTGRLTPDSDLDLLIVESAPASRHEESVKIRRAIGEIGFPVDVIVISKDRFEATKTIFGGIAYPAHKYGVVLYEAP